MADIRAEAAALLRALKGDRYAFGLGCFGRLGEQVASLGLRAMSIVSGLGSDWGPPIHEALAATLAAAGVAPAGELVRGAAPNTPREDVFRLAERIASVGPDVIVSVGGGSGIDAVKAAAAYATLGERHTDLDAYFGTGQVSRMLAEAGRSLPPIVAAQLASGSAAHLTKYANVTNAATAQKMLIVDEAIVPPRAVFDYRWTATMSPEFTRDGALDGVAHCLEVLLGAAGEVLARARRVCLAGIELIVGSVQAAVADGSDLAAREALGLGTDLGGCAIMIGGTGGAHLNSFSLVDILPHGRACAVMNPYYVVFFAEAVEAQLRDVGEIYRRAGYLAGDLEHLGGRDLGLAVAEGMANLSRDIGFPVTLGEVEGFTDAHVARCLTAAKDPKLAMKLRNMPIALTAETVDDTMGPILEAARTGDFGLVPNAPRTA